MRLAIVISVVTKTITWFCSKAWGAAIQRTINSVIFSIIGSFIIFSVLLRIFHAVANALVITSTFAYQAMEFPGSVAKVFSITRCVMNVTQLFGPLLGGVLHEAGGFYLPFAVMGGFQMNQKKLTYSVVRSKIDK